MSKAQAGLDYFSRLGSGILNKHQTDVRSYMIKILDLNVFLEVLIMICMKLTTNYLNEFSKSSNYINSRTRIQQNCSR